MNYKYLGNPSRNFCILASTQIMDPKDGREKIIFSNFVSGGTGTLIFIDSLSGEGEQLELPGDEGAWALYCLNGDRLLVGTCGLKGYLHCLDLKSRTWSEPLKDSNEAYIWNLTPGSDGMIYGGTYPGCVLLRYDPDRHTLENMGRMSPHDENQYSRYVYGQVPGRIFINCGMYKTHTAVWDMKTGQTKVFGRDGAAISKVDKDFVCTITGDKLDFYDPFTLEPLIEPVSAKKPDSLQIDNAPVSTYIKGLAKPDKDPRLAEYKGSIIELANGNIAGVMGQRYFMLKKTDAKLDFKRIPVDAPATQILSITAASDGMLWGSSNFGQTIFKYNPDDGSYWNTTEVCKNGGQVYGIRVINGKVFMTTYAGGDHIVYDPSKPWNQAENVNPVTLKPAGPDLIRPYSKSAVGPDGAFWTGWVAKYGVYGGGLTRVDPDTYKVDIWKDPVPGQAVESIASGEKYLYFVTSGRANGLKAKNEPFSLCIWDMKKSLVDKIQFPKGTMLEHIQIIGNYGLISTGRELMIFKCDTMEFLNPINIPASCTCILKYSDELAAVFCESELLFVNPQTSYIRPVSKLPGIVKTAAVNKQGEIFFVNTEKLYKLAE